MAKQKAAEEKKARAKQLRQASKAKDKKQRARYSIRGGFVHCKYCGDMVTEMEFDDHKVSHPTHIRERIWLGNAENSKDMNVMKKCGITHILNCTREIDLPKNISKKIKSFKRISIQDKNSETILDYINESNQFFEKALAESKFNVVFVHCREGRSRSVSFLSAYIMWKEKISFYAALSDIRSKRHIVLPNNKFYAELEKFDKELLADRQNANVTPRSKKFGTPNPSFKLKKLKKNGMKNGTKNGYNNSSRDKTKFGFPNGATDDMKTDPDESISNLSVISPLSPAINGIHHDRQRSSSLSNIEYKGRSPSTRSGRRGYATPSSSNGRALSPVQGSPVGKKYKNNDANSPWSDIIYDNNLNPSKKKKSSDKSKKKKKKNSDKKKKKKKDGKDLNVEEAMDVTDVFPAKKKKKDKKNTKKKTSPSKKKKNKTVSND